MCPALNLQGDKFKDAKWDTAHIDTPGYQAAVHFASASNYGQDPPKLFYFFFQGDMTPARGQGCQVENLIQFEKCQTLY